MQRADAGRNRAYVSWAAMLRRCLDPREPKYATYGGRGITVCDRWRDSFAAFYADMGPRPEGMSIDRIDNDGPYAPDNCRWATQAEQHRNRRISVLLTVDGVTMTAGEWGRVVGLSPQTIVRRLRRGLSDRDALYGPYAARPRATHCKQGHPMSGPNLYVGPDGYRRCRACHAAKAHARYTEERRHVA